MARNNELKAVVTADIRQFTNAMSAVGFTASAAATASIAAFAAITAGVIGLEKATIGAAKSYETLRIRLQLLNGDMKEGAKEFEKIRIFSEGSAFDTNKMVNSYIRLRALTGQKFAQSYFEDIAFGAKVAGRNVESMAAQVGEVVIRMNAGLTGSRLKRMFFKLGTVVGDVAVKELTDMADAGIAGTVILERFTAALGRYGDTAKIAYGQSAEGMEKQIGGMITGGLSALGGPALTEYKRVLRTIITAMEELGKSDAFKDLSLSLGLLMGSIADAMKTDAFRGFVINIIELTTLLVDGLNAVVKAMDFIANRTGALPVKELKDIMGWFPVMLINKYHEEGAASFLPFHGEQTNFPVGGAVGDPTVITKEQREQARVQRNLLIEARKTANSVKVFDEDR